MLEYFWTVLGQVITLFLLIAVGYVLGKLGKINAQGTGQMTSLLLYVVTPCVVWDTMQMHLAPERIAEAVPCAVLSLATYLGYSLIAAPLFRKSPPDVRAPPASALCTATWALWACPWWKRSWGRRPGSTSWYPWWCSMSTAGSTV